MQIIVTPLPETPYPTYTPFYLSAYAIVIYVILSLLFIFGLYWLVRYIYRKYCDVVRYLDIDDDDDEKTYGSDDAINYDTDDPAAYESGSDEVLNHSNRNHNGSKIKILSSHKENNSDNTISNQENIENPLIH